MVRRAPTPIPEIGKPFTQQTIVGWHSHYDQVATMRTVAKGSSVSQFEFIDENGGGAGVRLRKSGELKPKKK
jgi:hypothetical protein